MNPFCGATAGLPASASDDALERCGATGSVGELAIHAHAGEDSLAPAAPGLGRSSAPRHSYQIYSNIGRCSS